MNACMLFHNWSAWSDVQMNVFGQLMQYRWCKRCRKAQSRYVSATVARTEAEGCI